MSAFHMAASSCDSSSQNLQQLQDRLTDLVNCIICRNRYHNPKILPCYHVFCTSCLQSIINESCQNSAPCPICRKLFTPYEGKADNLASCTFMDDIIQLIGQKEGEHDEEDKQISCNVCDNSTNDVTNVCIHCNIQMCEICTEMHKRFRMENHNVLPIEDIRGTTIMSVIAGKKIIKHCDVHQGKVLDRFCTSCKRAICHTCSETTHHYHVVQRLSQATEEVKQFIAQTSQKMLPEIDVLTQKFTALRQMLTNLQTLRNNAKREVCVTAEGLIQRLRQKEESSLQEIDRRTTQCEKELQSLLERVDTQLKTRSSLLQYTDSLKTFGNDLQLTQEQSCLQYRVEVILGEEHVELPREEAFRLQFKPLQMLQELLDKDGLGCVTTEENVRRKPPRIPPRLDKSPSSGELPRQNSSRSSQENQSSVQSNFGNEDCRFDTTKNSNRSFAENTIPKYVFPSEETQLKTEHKTESGFCVEGGESLDADRTIRADRSFEDEVCYLNPVCRSHTISLPVSCKHQREKLNFYSEARTVEDQPPPLPERNMSHHNIQHALKHKGIKYSRVDVIANTNMKINGLAVTQEDDLVVVSNGNRKCVVYDRNGVFKNEITDKIISPWDAACATTDVGVMVYITDIGKTKGEGNVKKYRLDGTFIKQFITKLCKPNGIALSKSGEVFVCDTGENPSILVFSPVGKKLKAIKTYHKNERFICPWYISTSPDGDLIISDFGAGKLIILDRNFRKRTTLKQALTGIEVNTFKPAMCFTDDHMNVYAVDQKSSFIFTWNKQGLMKTLSIPTECSVHKPLGIVIDSGKRIVIASHSGNISKITTEPS